MIAWANQICGLFNRLSPPLRNFAVSLLYLAKSSSLFDHFVVENVICRYIIKPHIIILSHNVTFTKYYERCFLLQSVKFRNERYLQDGDCTRSMSPDTRIYYGQKKWEEKIAEEPETFFTLFVFYLFPSRQKNQLTRSFVMPFLSSAKQRPEP